MRKIPMIGRALQKIGSAMTRRGAGGQRRTPVGVGGGRRTARRGGGLMSMVRRFLR